MQLVEEVLAALAKSAHDASVSEAAESSQTLAEGRISRWCALGSGSDGGIVQRLVALEFRVRRA